MGLLSQDPIPMSKALQDYFSFLADDDIRIQGTRIGIEHILYEYIHNSKSPEAIADIFPSITLEQVYATILYYLQNQPAVEQYLADWLDYTLRAEAEQDENPDAAVKRLKQLRAPDTAA